MPALNPHQVDVNAEDFVSEINALPDNVYVMVSLPDPNAVGKGIVFKIKGANLKASISGAGGGINNYKGAWVADTDYVAGNIVTHLSNVYLCMADNSDTTFTASKWFLLTDAKSIQKDTTITSLTTTWTNIGSPFADTAVVVLSLRAKHNNQYYRESFTFEVGSLVANTTEFLEIPKIGQTSQVDLQKLSTGQLQIKRGSGSAAEFDVDLIPI